MGHGRRDREPSEAGWFPADSPVSAALVHISSLGPSCPGSKDSQLVASWGSWPLIFHNTYGWLVFSPLFDACCYGFILTHEDKWLQKEMNEHKITSCLESCCLYLISEWRPRKGCPEAREIQGHSAWEVGGDEVHLQGLGPEKVSSARSRAGRVCRAGYVLTLMVFHADLNQCRYVLAAKAHQAFAALQNLVFSFPLFW